MRRLRLWLAEGLFGLAYGVGGLRPVGGGAKGGAPNPAAGPGGGTAKAGVDKADIMATSQLDFVTAGGCSLYSGTGAPGALVGPTGLQTNPVAGDFYLRTDTPSTANQRLYVCTVGGGAPTWVGIV